jgi:hypothetical protein
MRLYKVLGIASIVTLVLTVSACASMKDAKVADASAPKAKSSTLHRVDPFTDPFDALNNPAVGFSPPPARAGRPIPH